MVSLYEPDKLPECFSSYTLHSCLKHGENGAVYLLNKGDEKFILKRGGRHARGSLAEEYALLERMRFPFLPRAIEFYQTNNESWLLREYVEGRTLQDVIDSAGAYSQQDAVRTALRLLEHIEALHAQTPPIIHRDVKPQNLVLTPNGELKIIDMGSAREYGIGKNWDTVYIGTRATAAPEQFGYSQTDKRTDIYAVGVLLVFLLSGEFAVKNFKSLPCSEKLRRIIAKCLAFDPAGRYRDAAALRTALSQTGAAPRGKRRIWAAAGGLLTVCAAIAAAVLWPRGAVSVSAPAVTPAPEVVVFAEPMIESAVRDFLGYNETQPVYPDDMLLVTDLCIAGKEILPPEQAQQWLLYVSFDERERNEKRGDIRSLQDLALCENLKHLTVDLQRIEDLSPLEWLPLESLGVQGNPVRDISSLSKCRSLNILYLSHTRVEDLSPIAELPNLAALFIRDTRIDSFEGIAAITSPQLRYIYIDGNIAHDYESLNGLTLNGLMVSKVTDAELEIICAAHQSLDTLNMFSCALTDLSPLAQMSRLRWLTVNANESALKLDALEQLTELDHLDISNSNIASYEPLFSMPALREVVVKEFQIPAIYAISPEPPFTVTLADY
jgi:predicted Ser/Thr protein kinase